MPLCELKSNGIKWVALRDQAAAYISFAVIKICYSPGIPVISHSDQGRTFESNLFHQIITAFGILKHPAIYFLSHCGCNYLAVGMDTGSIGLKEQ